MSSTQRHSGGGYTELIGQVIDGRYRLTALLGRGGIGSVYRAEHVTLRRPLAIKLVSPRPGHAMADRRRVEREAFATGRVAHPNCVAISDFGTLEDGTLFLVMELLSGESLGALLAREGRLPVDRALRVITHVLRGLGHAHSLGIVHRDLKPENVILVNHLGDRDFAKVLDFGLAKLVDEAEQEETGGKLTQTGITFGTPVYMSPEQAFGGAVDHRSDIYSASVMLFELIAGQPPFKAKEMRKVLAMHATRAAPRIREVAPDVSLPVEVEMLIHRGLAKEPENRPQSAADYLAEIERLPAGAPVAPPPRAASLPQPRAASLPPPPVQPAPGLESSTVALRPAPRPQSAPRRRRGYVIAGIGLAAVGAIVLAALASGDRAAPTDEAPGGLPMAAEDPEPEPETAAAPDPEPAPAPAPVADASVEAPGLAEVPPDPIPELAQIDRLRASKAALALSKLRKSHPDNAYLAFREGREHFERMVWRKGFAAYRDAIALEPAYRSDPRVIGDAIRSLASRSQAWRGVKFLEHDIGPVAIPQLEQVADSRSLGIRRHARRLLERLRAQHASDELE